MPPLSLLLALARGGGGGSVQSLGGNYSMLYSGSNGDGLHEIGLATSTDGGYTFTRYGSNPVMVQGANGTFDDRIAFAPQVIPEKIGGVWVMYYGGYDGTTHSPGRATSPDLITWTKYAGNPVVPLGGVGDPDRYQVIAPVILYEAGESPAYKLWYTGEAADGLWRLCYADSTDGLSWTKRGMVLDVGGVGEFDRYNVSSGVALKVPGEAFYRVIYAGQAATVGETHLGWATCTDPADPDTYTKQGQFTGGPAGDLTLSNGVTYQSSGTTCIFKRGSVWVGYLTCLRDSAPFTYPCVRMTSTDLVDWTVDTEILLPFDEGTFDTAAAENPSVVAT